MSEPRWTVDPEGGRPPAEVVALAEQVERDGGRALSLYQEPVGRHWQIFCVLPLDKVDATPYQRDLSPTHAKRLQEVIKQLDRFVDPVLVTSPRPGVYWTPNGNHRRTALTKLKRASIPAILVPDSVIVTDQARKIVLTVGEDGTVAPKVIRPGPSYGNMRIVRSGLAPGDRIVINGLMRARPGAKVTPQPGEIEPLTGAPQG